MSNLNPDELIRFANMYIGSDENVGGEDGLATSLAAAAQEIKDLRESIADEKVKVLKKAAEVKYNHGIEVWCICFETPEPSGTWVYPDKKHSEDHNIDELEKTT